MKTDVPFRNAFSEIRNPRWRLRQARDTDGPAVVALIQGILRSFRLRFDPRTIDRSLYAIEAHFRRPERRFWVLEEDRRIIGCVAIGRRSRATAELMKMYLAPHWRGRGLGRRMLRVALAFARRSGYRRVRIETNSKFTAAQALYRRAGFRQWRRVKIPPRCDAVYLLDL